MKIPKTPPAKNWFDLVWPAVRAMLRDGQSQQKILKRVKDVYIKEWTQSLERLLVNAMKSYQL